MDLTEAPKGGFKKAFTAKDLSRFRKPENRAKLQEILAKINKIHHELLRLEAKRATLARERNKLQSQKFTSDATIAPIFGYIEKHCQEFLHEARKAKNLLYRGMDGRKPFIGHPGINRIPYDTEIQVQTSVDKALLKAGFKAVRNNSIFTTGNPTMAEEYGQLHAIFPVDGYKFSWSQKYEDFYTDFVQPAENHKNSYRDIIYSIEAKIWDDMKNHDGRIQDIEDWNYDHPNKKKPIPPKPKVPDWFKKFQRADNNYTLDKIIAELSKNKKLLHDPMFQKLYAKWLARQRIYLKVATEAKFSRTNMAAALKSGHEIYILGTYVALPKNFIVLAQEQLLGLKGKSIYYPD